MFDGLHSLCICNVVSAYALYQACLYVVRNTLSTACCVLITVTVACLGFCSLLTLKAPIMTSADDIHKKYFIIVFLRKQDLIFHVNPLLGRGFT